MKKLTCLLAVVAFQMMIGKPWGSANGKQLKVIALVLWSILSPISAIAQEEFVCGNEAQIARAQTVRLQDAAALCRQDLMNDHPDCFVDVARWHVKLTASEAETLAAQLLQYANVMEAFDKQLEERMSHYTVSSSNSTVSAVDLRCSNVAVTVGGDRVTECLMCCYRRFGIPALDALRGNVKTMLPLFAANFGSFKGCEHLCVTTASSCGEFPNKANKDWWNPNTPPPSPPTPSKPECVSCPSGYHCNQAKDGCDADEPKPKPGTEHPA